MTGKFSPRAPSFYGLRWKISPWQIVNFVTVRRNQLTNLPPTHLKVFKRDGVLIFESKRKAAVAQTPPFPQDTTGFYI